MRVGFVSPAVGYGLFAARDLAKDEFIFHEAPLMTARFNEVFAADQALMQSQVAAYRAALTAHHDVTAVAFPTLAARFGVPPVSYPSAAATLSSPAAMGKNLVPARSQLQLAPSTVTPEQYAAYTGPLQPAPNTSSPEARAACLDFFKHYAFQLPPPAASTTTAAPTTTTTTTAATTTTREACIYLLASLINHCCTPTTPTPSTTSTSATSTGHGPNCAWRIGPSGLAHFVRPRHICVQARRAIRAGEQLTWDYGKREKGFAWACEVGREGGLLGHLGELGSLCGVL